MRLVPTIGCATLLALGASAAYADGGLMVKYVGQAVSVAASPKQEAILIRERDLTQVTLRTHYRSGPEELAWVVPVPSVPEVDVAEIDSFTELQVSTDPVFMLPPVPDCMFEDMVFESAPSMAESEMAGDDVTVFASGEAGPYEYDVVGTETGNVNALIDWLNENNYRITPEMEPLVYVYVEESMIFLAMKLQPNQGVQDIQPIKITYESQQPMIPLRLTAVAATPNMGVYTWVFGRAQAEAQNYAKLKVPDSELSLSGPFGGGTNYLQLVGTGVDRFEGKAFITEYAQPTSQLSVVDPLLQSLRQQYPYVTRFYGQLSPEEMTVDPVFDFNSNLSDVSNIHDLSDRTDMYSCRDDAINIDVSDITGGVSSSSNVVIPYLLLGAIDAACFIGFGIVLGGGIVFLSRRK